MLPCLHPGWLARVVCEFDPQQSGPNEDHQVLHQRSWGEEEGYDLRNLRSGYDERISWVCVEGRKKVELWSWDQPQVRSLNLVELKDVSFEYVLCDDQGGEDGRI